MKDNMENIQLYNGDCLEVMDKFIAKDRINESKSNI